MSELGKSPPVSSPASADQIAELKEEVLHELRQVAGQVAGEFHELHKSIADMQVAVREELRQVADLESRPSRRRAATDSASSGLQSQLVMKRSSHRQATLDTLTESRTRSNATNTLDTDAMSSSHGTGASDSHSLRRPYVSKRGALGGSRDKAPPGRAIEDLGMPRTGVRSLPLVGGLSFSLADRPRPHKWMTFILNKMDEDRRAVWDQPGSHETRSGARPWRRRAAWLLQGSWFDMAMGVVIVSNALCIGVEIQHSIDGTTWGPLSWLEHLFLAVYICELAIRVTGNDGRSRSQGRYTRSGWFLLDVGLVTVGVVSAWVVQPILASVTERGSDSLELVQQFLVLRILRLLRLVRALRLLRSFQELWKLCRGLVASAKTVLFACSLVLLTVYICACLGVELITNSDLLKDNTTTAEIVDSRFNSLMRTMLTLIAFTNADSISAVYEPIIIVEPMLAVFFGFVWLFVTVSLMNLVTAVIVDNAISQTSKDIEFERTEKKRQLKFLIPAIERLFDDLDKQTGREDGHVGAYELHFDQIKLPLELEGILHPDNLDDLFEFLDSDGSGTLDKEEFVERVCRLALGGIPVETIQTLQMLRGQKKSMADIARQTQAITRLLKSFSSPREVSQVPEEEPISSAGVSPALLSSRETANYEIVPDDGEAFSSTI
jgi:voltage-gated sodium channel